MEQMSENDMLLFRARLLLEEGRSEEALEVLEAIVPDGEKQRQEVGYFLGWCYISLKRWCDATNVLTPLSPQIDEEVESESRIDRERQALCLYRLGYAAVQFARFDEATRHFGRCIKLMNDKRVHLSPLLRIKAHYSLATSLMMRGLLGSAIQQYNEALHHFLHVEDEEEKAHIFYGLSETYRRADELEKARLAGEEALHRYVEVGNVVREGITLNLLGQIALEKKDYQVASDHFTQALAIGNTHGGPKMAMMNCAALAEVRLAENRLDEAKRYCTLACDLLDKVKDNFFWSQTYFTTAKVTHVAALHAREEERRQLLESTIHSLEQAKNALTGSDADADVAEIYKLWSQTFEELGLYEEAFAILRSGFETITKAQGPTWY